MGSAVRGRKPPAGEPLLDRAFRLLAAFGPADRSLSLTAMSARAGVPKSSALRIARQLAGCGALERLGNGEFVIGLRLPRWHPVGTGCARPRCPSWRTCTWRPGSTCC